MAPGRTERFRIAALSGRRMVRYPRPSLAAISTYTERSTSPAAGSILLDSAAHYWSPINEDAATTTPRRSPSPALRFSPPACSAPTRVSVFFTKGADVGPLCERIEIRNRRPRPTQSGGVARLQFRHDGDAGEQRRRDLMCRRHWLSATRPACRGLYRTKVLSTWPISQ